MTEAGVLKDDLKAWRERLGWTQVQAAEYLDVPLVTYKRWEQGRRAVQNPGPVRRLIRLGHYEGQARAIMQRTQRNGN